MKKIAALILNRNLPQLADELGDWILKQHSDFVDLYVLENGSDPDKYSKYANIVLETSRGPAGGINEGLHQLSEKGYEYIWVNYNDARYEQRGFLQYALNVMETDPAVALVMPFWKDNMWVYGHRKANELVTFSSILGFVVRREALMQIANHPHFKLEPLWDSSNFSNHDNILATLLVLYQRKLCAVTNRRFTVFELNTVADEVSEKARGFSAEEWKHTKGPADFEAWYSRAFPHLQGSYKEKRAAVIGQIEKLIRLHKMGSVNQLQMNLQRLARKVKAAVNRLGFSV